MATVPARLSPGPNLDVRLNTTAHYPALVVYLAVVAAHWVEHGVQAIQIYALGREGPDAQGVLGTVFPFLIESELLHWGYAAFMLGGLFVLRRGFSGEARRWWAIALGIQVWHFVEHAILLGQSTVDANLLGRAAPTSVVQLLITRVELHLVYNMLVLIPILVAVALHWFRAGNAKSDHGGECSCAPRFFPD